MKRIGHKGAHLIEHGNTIASFNAARSLPIDCIEFDLMRHPYDDRANGKLVFAHDPTDAAERESTSLITMEQGLDLLACQQFAEIELDVDMKHRGFEMEVIDALRSRNLLDRTIITTMHLESLRLIREHDPSARLGLTIPKVTRDWLSMPSVVKPLLAAGIFEHRLRQPARVAKLLEEGAFDAVMAFYAVITPRLVKAVHNAGGEIFAWTVDEAEQINKLVGIGVDGVVSNDPRLFDDLELESAAA